MAFYALLFGVFAQAAPDGGFPYGARLLRLDDRAADSTPPMAADHGPADAAEAGDYRAQIDALERGGPYAHALSESLAGLAQWHRERGELAQALRNYRRALHVVRINDGLHSEMQVPLVRAELDLYRESGELGALDERYDYYFRLFGAGQPPYTDGRMRAVLEYLRWQREALRLNLGGGRNERLLALIRQNEDILDNVAAQPAVSGEWRVELALSQLKNFYLLMELVEPADDDRRIGAVTPFDSSFNRSSGWEVEDYTLRRLQTLRRGALGRVGDLLRGAIDAAPGGEAARAQASLYLAMADWYQWNGREDIAGDSYREVARLLSAAGDTETLQAWLAQPVELPANGVFRRAPVPSAAGTEAAPVIRVSYAVSAGGRALDISAAEVPEAAAGRAATIQRALRKTRFRPRWINARPEPVAGLQRDYTWFN